VEYLIARKEQGENEEHQPEQRKGKETSKWSLMFTWFKGQRQRIQTG
jgi:hypothetical protein